MAKRLKAPFALSFVDWRFGGFVILAFGLVVVGLHLGNIFMKRLAGFRKQMVLQRKRQRRQRWETE